jgi:hypothetical protein
MADAWQRRWPALLAAVVLVAGALWQLWAPNGDLFQYRCFALAFWRGSAVAASTPGCLGRLPAVPFTPLHVLPWEYPPLALVPFSVPLALAGGLSMTLYVAVFNLLMLACLAATGALLTQMDRTGRAACWFWLWLAIGATTIALVRFDALPALIVIAALALARRGPSPWAYALLAAGTLLKLYPALFIPFLAVWDWQRRAETQRSAQRWLWLSGPLGALAGCAVVQLAADRLAGTSGIPWLSVQGDRPPQIESSAAALTWLIAILTGRGGEIHAVSAQRSAAFTDAPGRALATVTLLVAASVIAWALWRVAAGGMAPLRGMAAALAALMAGASVFSPQYLVWATPLIALTLAESDLASEALRLLWTVLALITTIMYSIGYLLAWPAHPGLPLGVFMSLALVRDALVWMMALALVLPTVARRIAPLSQWLRVRAASVKKYLPVAAQR